MPVYRLLENASEILVGKPISLEQVQDSLSVQVILTGAGAVSATIDTLGSTDGVNYFKLATTDISGVASATEGFTVKDPWQYIKCRVIAVSVGAIVNIYMMI